MLDIRYIRAHADEVQAAARHKGYEVSIAALLACDDQRRELQQRVDAVRTTRNETAAQMKGGNSSPKARRSKPSLQRWKRSCAP